MPFRPAALVSLAVRCRAASSAARLGYGRQWRSTAPLSTAVQTRDDSSEESVPEYLTKLRNIGISAHIDSGKTTLTERILYYTGRIREIHDVRGKDGVGAKMDSMDLEREKGITIQSAATYCAWKDYHINIIDTPGHVDFTIEVERALRVLDGAVLVLCGVAGVQSQSITVDRQMKRYSVPRLAFVNKLDRAGANPWKVIGDLRSQLGLNAAPVQIPIGLESEHSGVVCLITKKAFRFDGDRGETIVELPGVPESLQSLFDEKRMEMIERLADVDDEIAELFLAEEEISVEQLKAAIRKQTIALKYVPVFMGSAFKNKGVQLLLDGVLDFLPNPAQVPNYALDLSKGEERVPVLCKPDLPPVALAFKLEEGKFGQLTYMRIYQGAIKRGGWLFNMKNNTKVKVPRLVRMHSDEMEEITEIGAGDVCAMFGVDCSSMDSFTDGSVQLAMTSMFVPAPVISLAVKPKNSNMFANFSKALQRFSKEDPTLHVSFDEKTKETIISGMGELHLEIYVERLRREYNVDCQVGHPNVNYRETIKRRADFNYLHKKQTGGQGQYARVIGYVEPLDEEQIDKGETFEFINEVVGTNIPPEYIPSCEKGAKDAVEKGPLVGHPAQGIRVVLKDGQAHTVDSSDMAFRIAAAAAVREAMRQAQACVLEPIMKLEVTAPSEFQGNIMGQLNRRMALIQSNEVADDGTGVTITAEVPLAQMFGYSTDLRSITQGKGEFTMEYRAHAPVTRDVQETLIKKYKEQQAAEAAAK